MCSMRNSGPHDLVITGAGIVSAVGQGKEAFGEALLEGRHAFGVMQRPGRQNGTSFIGAEIESVTFPEAIARKVVRSASWSGQAMLTALYEAWNDAGLDSIPPKRIGLVIGGSNVQQREQIEAYRRYEGRLPFLSPTYGLSFMDSDLCGFCTEQFGIQGFAYTVGGASASGQLAVIRAAEAVQSGQVDICLAAGALMDLSYWECQALRALGAMGSDRYAERPGEACRPFDTERDGFIYGEACGVIVIEKGSFAERRKAKPYASVAGWAMGMDGNRNPNPSYEGECRVISQALHHAGLSSEAIDYINPHGTGSAIGDETELRALRDSGLSHAYINATKSITGHGLTAAGTVEIIATLLQMKLRRLHPTRNLQHPMDESFRWVRDRSVSHDIGHALNLSMGFGGMNTAICLSRHAGT